MSFCLFCCVIHPSPSPHHIYSASAGIRPPWACKECSPGFFFEDGITGATSQEEACPLSCVRNSSHFEWYPRRYRAEPPASLAASCDNKTVLCDLPGEGRPELPLSYGGSLKDGQANRFRKLVDGLDGASSVATSPDGTAVYVAGYNDDALSWYLRKSDGSLVFGGVLKDGGQDANGNTVDGLDGAYSVTTSPDGTAVYVAGYLDKALSWYSRQSDGSLVFGGVLKDGGQDANGNTVDELGGARSVTTSPDGTAVYVAGRNDDALSWYAIPSCASCPRGHSCPQDGSDTMLICKKGTVQDFPRQTSCTTCDRGSYQDARGQFFCKACARGRVGLERWEISCICMAIKH